MGVFDMKSREKVNVPWGQNFEYLLAQLGQLTYKYEGEDLAHEIHKNVMEAKFIQIEFYKKVRLMLAICIGLLAAILLKLTF